MRGSFLCVSADGQHGRLGQHGRTVSVSGGGQDVQEAAARGTDWDMQGLGV